VSDSIPVYKPPKAKKPKAHAAAASSSSSSSSSGGGAKPKAGGGGGKASSSASSAANAYAAAQKKAQNKAARRYIDQAKSMSGQIAALKNSLSEGFKAALTQRLANISLVQGQQDSTLMEGYNKRVKALDDSAADNDKAESDASFQNLGNRARERANAVSEAMNMGAGESDVIRSGLMSLRNWDANQGEINRSYFDTLRSVNSSLTDLNVDTKTARVNMASQANADRDQVWSQYYDQRSETYTQLGNLYGQQGELYGMAQEQHGSKGTKKLRKHAVALSDKEFMHASRANSHAYDNPGVGAALMDWQGQGPIQGEVNNNTIASVPDTPEMKKPEGATLRKWTT
jgi:hypothetical protein